MLRLFGLSRALRFRFAFVAVALCLCLSSCQCSWKPDVGPTEEEARVERVEVPASSSPAVEGEGVGYRLERA